MSDLREDLHTYFVELASRVEAGVAASPAGPRHRVSTRLVLVACLALVVGLVGFAVVEHQRDSDPQGLVTTPDVVRDDLPLLNGTWRDLPTDLGSDPEAAILRTDDAIVTFHTENDGGDIEAEVFRPSTGELTTASPSAQVWRAFPTIVWTGTEALIVGGSNGPGIDDAVVAYDPRDDAWRALPNPPGYAPGTSDGQLEGGIWNGSRLVFWSEGLALDPATGAWSTIAPFPLETRFDPAAAAIGNQIAVWGGCTQPGDFTCDGRWLTDGAVYDPAADTWTPMPASPITLADDPLAASTGSALLVTVDALNDADSTTVASFDPAADTWHTLPASPHPSNRGATATWTGSLLILYGGYHDGVESGATTALDPTSGNWYRLSDGPARSYHQAEVITPGSIGVVGGLHDPGPAFLDIAGPDTDPPPVDSITGTLADGRTFTLQHDPLTRLCLTVGGGDKQTECDSSGSIGMDDDQTTPRLLPDVHSPYDLVVAYGYLPGAATGVEVTLPTGVSLSADVVLGAYPRMWAVALPPGLDPIAGPSPDIRYQYATVGDEAPPASFDLAGDVGPNGGVIAGGRELQSTPAELFDNQPDGPTVVYDVAQTEGYGVTAQRDGDLLCVRLFEAGRSKAASERCDVPAYAAHDEVKQPATFLAVGRVTTPEGVLTLVYGITYLDAASTSTDGGSSIPKLASGQPFWMHRFFAMPVTAADHEVILFNADGDEIGKIPIPDQAG